jgi:hypothetical protein
MHGCNTPPWFPALLVALALGSTPTLGAGTGHDPPDVAVIQKLAPVSHPNQVD